MPAQVRRGPGTVYRRLRTLSYLLTRDRLAAWAFLRSGGRGQLRDRARMIGAMARTTNQVRGYHTLAELLTVNQEILARTAPVVVECGAGSGSSTAKLSLAVRAAGGELHVFDSFRGIPPNDEVHQNLDGRRVVFRAGAFTGRVQAVKRVVEAHGAPEVCHYYKGLFEETLPLFRRPVDVVLLDVDLLSSTRTCLRELFPQLTSDGVLYSQDGHLVAIVELLRDQEFWRGLGVPPPAIEGLGRAKLLRLQPQPREPSATA
ncbi:MAG: class I SAM-dependent methyltransferase [Deltaproteobacteria bacterium]|nr:class I SAM-dependent methyltransferase [Deltaproteobacteria bacterium]